MKKLYMLMIIIFSIFVVSNVKAYTMGTPYGQITTSNYYTGNFICNNAKQQCGKTISLNAFNVSCDTPFCFIQFTNVSTFADLQSTTSQQMNVFTQVYSSNNSSWNYCETIGGVSNCMVKKNSTITNLEIKFANYYDELIYGVDLNDIKVFNSPTDSTSQLNNIQQSIDIQSQQQQQQHQQIVDDDTSGNANNFNSDISNFNVPNDSHALDILGTLQSFVGNIQVSGACSRISVPIPFTDKNFVLPCMTTDVYSVHFREIVVIWQLICRGVGYYYILVNVLKLVKETLDPFNFKLEVLDL